MASRSLIRQLNGMLAGKKISRSELFEHYFNRAKLDKTNSFISLCPPSDMSKDTQGVALGLDEHPVSFFDGVPFGLKDNIVTKGVETTCASEMLRGFVPVYDAVVAERLNHAGAQLVGKLNMDEFAMGGSNENSAYGPVRNPVALDRVPGGSSGGSAASVKAGLVPFSLGSDTGGSIRLPASYTGTVGLKPTYGSVSRYGLVAFASSLDQIGPLTTSCEDAALVHSLLSGQRPGEPLRDSTLAPRMPASTLEEMRTASNRKVRVGIPKEYFQAGLATDVAKAMERIQEVAQKQGHVLVPVSLPHTSYSVAVYYIVAVCEASSNLSRYDGVRYGLRESGRSLQEMYKKTRSHFGDEVKRRIVLGTFALSSGYYDAYFKKACQVRRLIQQDFNKVFETCDVLLSPVSATTAFKLGEKVADPLQMYLNDILTIPVNLAGLPALSVPCGRDSQGLPMGAQWIGPAWSEGLLLAMGQMVEDHVFAEEVNHGLS